MPEFKMDDQAVKQIKTMIKLAQTRPIPFGISFDKGEKDLAFVTHKSKNPKSLYKDAKDASGGKNGALGEMTVEGNEIIFACIKNPKGNCRKYVKKFLSGGNILKKVISKKIPDFRFEESEAAAPDKAAPAEDADGAASATGAVDTDGGSNPKLPKMRAVALIAKRTAALPQSEARKALGAGLREVAAQIAAGEAEAARSGLTSLQAALKAAEEDVASSNPSDNWIEARNTVNVSLAAFRSKLSASDDPNLKRIAEHGLSGITDGNNVALMAALVGYNTSSPADRGKNAEAVQKRINEYREFLASSRLIGLCEQNPFGQSIEIRGPLTIALDKLETAVAA